MQHFFREDSPDHIIFQKEFKVNTCTYDILNILVFYIKTESAKCCLFLQSLSDIKPVCTKDDFRDVTLHGVNTEEEEMLQCK